MIVLDTNVVSEPLKLHADPAVVAWLAAQAPETLYLTATNLSDLLIGIGTMPVGKRRDGSALILRKLLPRLRLWLDLRWLRGIPGRLRRWG